MTVFSHLPPNFAAAKQKTHANHHETCTRIAKKTHFFSNQKNIVYLRIIGHPREELSGGLLKYRALLSRFSSDVLELRNFLRYHWNWAKVVTHDVYIHTLAISSSVGNMLVVYAYCVGLLLCLFFDTGYCEDLKTWSRQRVRHHAFFVYTRPLRCHPDTKQKKQYD